jgi:hypothetical protein
VKDHAQAISFPRVLDRVVGRAGGCTRGEPDSMCQYNPQIERKSPQMSSSRSLIRVMEYGLAPTFA